MQFHIRTLLAVMFAVSLLCGLVFAAPPVVATPILCALLWISPSLWINGIIYGRGAWRPFFIGGVAAGIVPHLISLYISVMAVVGLFQGDGLREFFDADSRWANLYVAATFLAPGPFSLAGGLTGVWVYWMFQPAKAPQVPDSQQASEYTIVSGRLTTTPIERVT